MVADLLTGKLQTCNGFFPACDLLPTCCDEYFPSRGTLPASRDEYINLLQIFIGL
jgi:hypothetical protein